MAKKRMGYEAQLFYGTAGSTATEQVLNATDVDWSTEPERGDTTVRGNGLSVPIVTGQVTALKPQITFKMLAKDDDAQLADMIAAADTGAAVALKTKHYSSGTGYDGDWTLSKKYNAPLKGEATYEFTAEATDEAGRTPDLSAS